MLFSTKFALRASEIASLWNICYANVKCLLTQTWQISFHIATKEQYFTMCVSTLFHIERQRDISLFYLLHGIELTILTFDLSSKLKKLLRSLYPEKSTCVLASAFFNEINPFRDLWNALRAWNTPATCEMPVGVWRFISFHIGGVKRSRYFTMTEGHYFTSSVSEIFHSFSLHNENCLI